MRREVRAPLAEPTTEPHDNTTDVPMPDSPREHRYADIRAELLQVLAVGIERVSQTAWTDAIFGRAE